MTSTAFKTVSSDRPSGHRICEQSHHAFRSSRGPAISRFISASLPVMVANMILLGGCGWVDSTGQVSTEAEQGYQLLTGSNDIVDLVGEETLRVDASRLLQNNNAAGIPISDVAGAQSSISWQRIGSSEITECSLANFGADTSLSLTQACDSSIYNTEMSAADEPDNEPGKLASTDENSDASCALHILEVAEEPGIYELHPPAITRPVVLHYALVVESQDSLDTEPDIDAAEVAQTADTVEANQGEHLTRQATTLTVCLLPAQSL